MTARTNAEIRADELLADIQEGLNVIDRTIQEVREEAWVEPYKLRDTNGRFVLADLIHTKSQLILAEVMLMKGGCVRG